MVGVGFNQVNSVNIYKILGDKILTPEDKLNRLKKQKRQILYIYTIATILITLVGYFLTPILLPKYSGSVNYFIILSLYGYAYCLYFLNTNFLFYYKKTKNIMYTTFFSSILHLLLSILISGYSLYLTACLYVFTQSIVVYFIRKMAIKELTKELSVNYEKNI